jgi:HAD superfamily hydrolase (TIGR01509 family)
MLKAVIFDMDGTLLDSVDYHAKAWDEAFRDYGYTFDFQKIRAEIGKGGDQLLPVFLTEEEIARDGKSIENHRSDLLKERYLSKFTAFPKVRSLFLRLKEDHIQTVLASSSKSAELEVYEKIAKIDDLVDSEVSSEDVTQSKPAADIFVVAVKKLHSVSPQDVVGISDTPHDATAARKAGLKPIGVLCGGVSDEKLRDAGCAAIYKDPEDLLNRYETWTGAGQTDS